LTHRVYSFLKKSGFDVDFENVALPSVVSSSVFSLRPYQQDAADAFLQQRPLWGVIYGKVRSGKTIIASHIIDSLPAPHTLICERLEIAYQAVEHLKKTRYSVGIIGDGKYEDGDVVVSTIQSACQAFDQQPPFRDKHEQALAGNAKLHAKNRLLNTGFLVVDEAHHAAAQSYGKVIKAMDKRWGTLGLSGTPWRDDNKDILIEANCGPIVYEVSYEDLIAGGWLVKPHIMFVHLPRVNYAGHYTYQEIYNDYVVNNPKRNEIISMLCRKMSERGKTTLVIVRYITHGEQLEKVIPGSRFISEKSGTVKRQQAWQALKDKKVSVVITTLADEGLDLPSLDSTIIATGGKSSTKVFQRLRCLTACEGKDKAYVFDFFDDARYLKQHSKLRLGMYQAEPSFEVEEVMKYV
jgi:superfamily II DNA or RNA helicase